MLIKYTFVLCFFNLSPSISAYTLGSIGINGSPKHVENVGTGSFTPNSVPASFAVNPVTKWYIAASWLNLEIGGNTPKESAVKNITTFGIPPTPDNSALGI